MSGQITVVTGGGRGIGAATCERLARDGHDIVLGYRSDTEAAERVAERVRAAGARCVTVRGDTASEEDVDALFDAAASLGPVTGLVNKRVVTTDSSIDQRFVVRFTGSSQEYACDDTRCALVKKGHRLDLSCKRHWQYAGRDGWDCRYAS